MVSNKIDQQVVEDILALTPLQEGILFHYLRDPDSQVYFVQLSITLSGEINQNIFLQAWKIVKETNEMLRTVFRWKDFSHPIQVVLKKKDIPISFFDFSHIQNDNEQTELIKSVREEDRNTKIDIETDPVRIIFCKLNKFKYEMIISHHHILYDGWSNGIILKEFFEACHNLSYGKIPEIPAKSKFCELIRWYKAGDKAKQKIFWQEYLQGFNSNILQRREKLCKENTDKVEKCNQVLDSQLTEKIKNFCIDNNLTLATFFYSAWGLVLQKYSNSNDVIFGTTLSGRTPKINNVDKIVGLFINTIPLRLIISSDESVINFIKKTGTRLMEREEYEYTSLSEIKQCCHLDYESSLFDTIVVMENYPLDVALLRETQRKINAEAYSMFEVTNFDLTVVITDISGLKIGIDYKSARFCQETVDRMLKSYINVITQVVQNPDCKISNIEIMTAEEKYKLLNEFNATEVSFSGKKSIYCLFEEWVQKSPESIALIFKESRMTYGELNQKANRIAWHLNKIGVSENTIVGIMIENSFELIIGLMGILKAGGAYLPIDPFYPEERIRYIFENSRAPILLTNNKSKQIIPSDSTKVISIEEILHDYTLPENNLNLSYNEERLLYLLYTSGSTGNPKGVMIKSHAFMNLLNWFITEFDINEYSRILLMAPISFDLAQKNLYSALINGGCLCLCPSGLLDYNRVSDIIESKKITMVNCAPSAFYPLIDFNSESRYTRLDSLQKVFLGGEPINITKLLPWVKGPNCNCEIVNTYGPTECTDIATFYRINQTELETMSSIPIGKPIYNTNIYILGENLKLLPIGVGGELCIGGVGLAEGYYSAQNLTNEKFIRSNHLPSEYIYRTGDLAQWLSDGNIEFLGRMDNQVKIRGIRIELEEIEKCIQKYKDVKENVVTVWEINGNSCLTAYLVGETRIDINYLRNHLRYTLPDYMIPSYYIQLEKLPLTPNGKIDRKNLPCPNYNIEVDSDYNVPKNEFELQIMEIWKEVLGVNQIGTNCNFFEVGGNSLLLIQLHLKIQKLNLGEVTIGDIFSYPTISKLAGFISSKGEKEKREIQLAPMVFPPEFYSCEVNYRTSVFEFKIEMDTYQKTVQISKAEGVNINVFLLSLYIYILAQVTGNERVTVPAMISRNNEVKNLTLNLKEIENINALYDLVRNAINLNDESKIYELQEISTNQFGEGSTGIIPMVYCTELLRADINLSKLFDLILEINQKANSIELKMEYNQRKLVEDKIEQLFYKYLELIVFVTKNYNIT